MGRDVAGDIKLFACVVGLGNGFRHDVEVVKLVVAHAQAVAGLSGVYRIGSIGKGVAHGLIGASGGQQFRFSLVV